MLTQYAATAPVDLIGQANAAICALPATHALYAAAYKASTNFEVQDYITITDIINKALTDKGIDHTKLKDNSFLKGSAFQKYYVWGELYKQKLTEVKVKAEEVKVTDEQAMLQKNANNAVITCLKDPKHALYATLTRAKSKASEVDYFEITSGIDDILMACKINFLKLTSTDFLNGTAFKPYYLLPKDMATKAKAVAGIDIGAIVTKADPGELLEIGIDQGYIDQYRKAFNSDLLIDMANVLGVEPPKSRKKPLMM